MRACLVVAVVMLLGAPSRAQDLRAAAKQAFAEGSKAFAEKRYAEAYELIHRAYAIAPHPDLLFNLGRCLEELNRLPEAIDAYDRYLAVHNDAEVTIRVERLRNQLARMPLPTTPDTPPPVTPPPPETPVVVALPTPVLIAPPPPRTPVYKRWWLWTTVGLVAGAGLGVGLGLGLTRGPSLSFPAINVQMP